MFCFKALLEISCMIISDYEFLAYVCIVNKKFQYMFVVINLLS